jgi:hypothetical protein
VYEDLKNNVGSTHGVLFISVGIHAELQTFIIISACAVTIHIFFLSVVIVMCFDFIH